MCGAVTMQDFRRLYEVQRIVQACLPDDERGQVVLPGWMRAYAAAAWQDRFFAEQNFTPLQQVRPASPCQSQALGACVVNGDATEDLSVGASLQMSLAALASMLFMAQLQLSSPIPEHAKPQTAFFFSLQPLRTANMKMCACRASVEL